MTRIAFYAPLKPADHRVASGDRTVARLFLKALAQAGYDVVTASRDRTWVRRPSLKRMMMIRQRSEEVASRLARHWRRLPPSDRPAAWFTYHVYYRAVDWIGPRVAERLSIPYVIAEASHAPKRAHGPWAYNHLGAEQAIRAADAILCLNPADRECLREIVPNRRLVDFPPFLDIGGSAHPAKEMARRMLAADHDLDPGVPWLLAVGMMRLGDKLASYRLLGQALKTSKLRRALLLVVGDGPARPEVKRALSGLPMRVVFAGQLSPRELSLYYAASDLLVWPAINEAFGMALLEAQAQGLPVLAGASGGVPAIIADGKTGFLAPPGDAAAFRTVLIRALRSDLSGMAAAARAKVKAKHSLDQASVRLAALLSRLGARP